MIAKIEKLKDIGNFENYTSTGDVTLKKMSIIYAENGSGKTTLAQVLHSLGTDDSSVINCHKRIGATENPEVIIKDEANHQHIYTRNRWNHPMPEIEVFDAHFVANNVYSGFEISSDHHKGLYQFVVGATGISFVKKIERVKNLISAQNATINELRERIIATVGYNDVDKICGLVYKPNVDIEIENKEKELAIARNGEQIKKQPLPQAINIPNLPFCSDQICSILAISVDGIGQDYLKMVEEHITDLNNVGITNSTDWVYRGLTAKMDNCPFCGQALEGVQLIKGYNQFFSEAYQHASKVIHQAKKQFDSLNIANFILQLTSQYKRLEDVMKYWSTLIPSDKALPPFPINDLRLEDKYNDVQTIINNKLGNPVVIVDSEVVRIFDSAVNKVKQLCESVNQFVLDYSTRITELLTQIRPIEDVEKELKLLKIYKARFEEPLKSQCSVFDILNHQLLRLRKINAYLQQQQKAASVALFQQYGRETNNYLNNVFMTPFQIADVRDVFKGASRIPNLDYTLTYNGTPISQGDDGTSNLSFRNVLSEGDKNTIAFSFFMAKLITDHNLSDKIIVFDDPLTSLDQNRRNETINQLVFLHQRCKQVIVLSHNFHFLIDLNARNEIKTSEKKVLMIVKGLNSARIEPYELKRDWVDKFKRSIEMMEAFVNNPSPGAAQEDAVNGIRLTLELLLKLKYCMFVSDQNLTFGQVINTLESSSCTFVNPNKTEVISKLRNLNSVSWRTHHASMEERSVYQEVSLSISEAVRYVSMALNMLFTEL